VLNKIFMSERICASHLYLSPLESSQSMAFCDHYYQTTGVERNPSIKHSIEHNDSTQFFKKLPKSKYIVVEHSASRTKHNEETLEFYSSIVSFLKREKQYEIALIGGPKDPMVDGCLNYLGESLYDTYTLIKHSDGFISCNSGNSTLTNFFEDLLVIEIDTQFDTNQSTSRLNYKNNIHYIKKEECFAEFKKLL